MSKVLVGHVRAVGGIIDVGCRLELHVIVFRLVRGLEVHREESLTLEIDLDALEYAGDHESELVHLLFQIDADFSLHALLVFQALLNIQKVALLFLFLFVDKTFDLFVQVLDILAHFFDLRLIVVSESLDFLFEIFPELDDIRVEFVDFY